MYDFINDYLSNEKDKEKLLKFLSNRHGVNCVGVEPLKVTNPKYEFDKPWQYRVITAEKEGKRARFLAIGNDGSVQHSVQDEPSISNRLVKHFLSFIVPDKMDASEFYLTLQANMKEVIKMEEKKTADKVAKAQSALAMLKPLTSSDTRIK